MTDKQPKPPAADDAPKPAPAPPPFDNDIFGPCGAPPFIPPAPATDDVSIAPTNKEEA